MSFVVQLSESSHNPAVGVFVQAPDAGLQLSVVHELLSLQSTGGPPPMGLIQRLFGPHVGPVVIGIFWQPRITTQKSLVHTFPSVQLIGAPGAQAPA